MNDARLDEAARALREETDEVSVDADATLSRVLASLGETGGSRAASPDADAALDAAIGALREETDGEVDPEATLARVLASVGSTGEPLPLVQRATPVPQRREKAAPRRRPIVWTVMAAAAAVAMVAFGPTAFAWSLRAVAAVRAWTGATAPSETTPHEAPHAPVHVRHAAPQVHEPVAVAELAPPPVAPVIAPMPAVAPVITPTPALAPTLAPAHVAMRDTQPRHVAVITSGHEDTDAHASPSASDTAAPPTGSTEPQQASTATATATATMTAVDPSLLEADRAERAMFEEAQALHTSHASPGSVVAAWDAYLGAHPSGRFTPEARYNRALALIRAGRTDDARAALTPIADANGYRAHEARALLDALARRTSQ